MFKYLIRLFTVFSLLFPVVTHAAISTDFSTEFQTCMDSARVSESCAKVESVGCERPERCDASATCTATADGCTVTCTWSGCSGSIIQIVPAEICKPKQVPAGCLEVSYDGTCTEYSNPCQLGDDDCGCEVKFNGCYATCEFNCGTGYYITSNTGGIIGKTCAKCTAGCLCDGVNEDCSGQPKCENGYWLNGECVACPSYASCSDGKIKSCYKGYSLRTVNEVNQCHCPSWKYENLAEGECEPCPALLTNGMCIPCPDGMVVNGACVSCKDGLVENGACVECTKNGKCENGKFIGCNASYIKYYGTDGLACVACGDRCMDNSTCPLYGECSTDTSNTGPEFEQCMDGFKMVLDPDTGLVKCLCDVDYYINSSGQCVACLANAVCSDEKVTGCKQGFQKLTDESGNIIGCAGCTPNGTCLNGVFQYCNNNYYGDKNGCYKCPDFASLTGQSTAGSNKNISISNCSVTASKDGTLGEDERGYFYFETGTCNATNVTIE